MIGLPIPFTPKPARRQPRHMVFIGAGLLGCFLLSSCNDAGELRQLKPILDTLDDAETANTVVQRSLLVQKLRNHSQLSAEL